MDTDLFVIWWYIMYETSIPPYNFVAGGITSQYSYIIYHQITNKSVPIHYIPSNYKQVSTHTLYTTKLQTSQYPYIIYHQITNKSVERRIPFFFDDFHFYRSRVIGLDMTENRIFTLCRMITWVVFLRMFWNFISS
jgi:hypothetical protein